MTLILLNSCEMAYNLWVCKDLDLRAETMSKDSRGFYEFGQFRMDPSRKILLRDGEPVLLTSKAFEMLQVLIERSDKVISKDELMKALWPDSFVEESNLTQHISVLRKALGETPQDHRYILTFPGRGYRFANEIAFGEPLVSASRRASQSSMQEQAGAHP